jgi:hypothetical protein
MTKALMTALLLLAIVFIVAHLEYRFAATEQSIREEAGRRVELRPCDATIKDGTSAQMSSERCYFLKGGK